MLKKDANVCAKVFIVSPKSVQNVPMFMLQTEANVVTAKSRVCTVVFQAAADTEVAVMQAFDHPNMPPPCLDV